MRFDAVRVEVQGLQQGFFRLELIAQKAVRPAELGQRQRVLVVEQQGVLGAGLGGGVFADQDLVMGQFNVQPGKAGHTGRDDDRLLVHIDGLVQLAVCGQLIGLQFERFGHRCGGRGSRLGDRELLDHVLIEVPDQPD